MASLDIPIVGRVPIGSRVTGGDIVAIILKARKLKRSQKVPPGVTVQPTRYEYIAIPVDAKLQETYMLEAEVTQFPVESGAMMSDHVIIRPLRIDLAFEVSNTALGAIGVAGSQALDSWFTQLLSRQTVTLQTKHTMLKNMVCTSIQAVNEAPFWGKLAFQVSFVQISVVTLSAVKFTDEIVLTSSKMTPVNSVAGQPDFGAISQNDLGKSYPQSITILDTSAANIFKVRDSL